MSYDLRVKVESPSIARKFTGILQRGPMGLFKILLVFVVLAPVCHTLQQSLKLKELKTDLLSLLEVKEKPAIKRTRYEVPRYVIELWRKQAFKDGYTKEKSPGRTIRTFFREPKDKRGPHKHLFTFNLTTIRQSEKIGHASLRIFKRRSRLPKPRGHFKITVYRLSIPWRKENRRWKKKLVFLDSKMVKCRKEGEWIDFNVTSAVKFWTNYRRKNFGLWVSVRGYRVPSSDFNVATGGRKDPFLLEFGIDRKQLQKARAVREEKDKNEAEEQDKDEERHKETTIVEATRTRSRRSMSTLCKRHRLFVKFHDLNWDDWIIAPRGFSAYYCMGTCPEIIEKYFNPTNHAIIQNLIHHRQSKDVPAACCVPTKLHSITMLYFELDGSIVMKEYGEMVASSCGCR